jgi:hypothetical protein
MAGKAVKRQKAARYGAPMPRTTERSASIPPANGRPGGGAPVKASQPYPQQQEQMAEIRRALNKSKAGKLRKRA